MFSGYLILSLLSSTVLESMAASSFRGFDLVILGTGTDLYLIGTTFEFLVIMEFFAHTAHNLSQIIVADMDQVFNQLVLNDQSYIVIITRGHAHDKVVLAQTLHRPATYIGMIGSKRKQEAMYSALLAEGFAVVDTKSPFSDWFTDPGGKPGRDRGKYRCGTDSGPGGIPFIAEKLKLSGTSII